MSEKVTCAQRIREGLAARDMTQADLCRATGIGKSAMSQYVNGGLVPRQDRTYLIAQALNVSEAWLIGFDVPMEKDKPASSDGSELAEIMEIFKSLSSENRAKLLELSRLYLDAQRRNTENK